MTIWGNHSATQYPDLFHAEVSGRNAAEVVGDQAWLENDFIPTVQKRGAAIIEARGASSAASRGVGARSTTPATGCSAAPRATGCRWRSAPTARTACPRASSPPSPSPRASGEWEIVQGLEIDDFSRARIDASVAELAEERDAVKGLGLI